MRDRRSTRAEDVVNTLVDYPEVWVWLLAVVSINESCWAGGGLLALISLDTMVLDLHFHIQHFRL